MHKAAQWHFSKKKKNVGSYFSRKPYVKFIIIVSRTIFPEFYFSEELFPQKYILCAFLNNSHRLLHFCCIQLLLRFTRSSRKGVRISLIFFDETDESWRLFDYTSLLYRPNRRTQVVLVYSSDIYDGRPFDFSEKVLRKSAAKAPARSYYWRTTDLQC